ncbi:MAG: FecR domain-containing protein [Planctomycetes bacterium]|nr:FecR domain-containing protein [Planctomycetota bacterium]
MIKTKVCLILVCGLLLCGLNALSQDAGDFGKAAAEKSADETKPEVKPEVKPEAKPESKPESGGEVLEVTVDAVEGEVEVKLPGEKEWIPAEKGMKLKEGTRVSTGFKSKIVLLFADNSTVVVKPLTQMNISRFEQKGATVETNLKIRVGSIRVKVTEDQPVKTDMKISTPNATASVRGTEIEEVESSQHFGDSISVDSGEVQYDTQEGSMPVGGGETTNDTLINPIENAIMDTVANIAPNGVTSDEFLNSFNTPATGGDLISDANSETNNPVLDKIEEQEKPTDEQLNEYNNYVQDLVCPICGYYPCICGGEPQLFTCPGCGYPSCSLCPECGLCPGCCECGFVN